MKIFRVFFISVVFTISSVIIFAQESGPTLSLIGRVISDEDTGLGPFNEVTITNFSTGRNLYFIVFRGD